MTNQEGGSSALEPAEPSARKKFGLWNFLNSQFGLWLLGSVVVGLISILWNQRLAKENEQREDSQFVANMLPYLTNSSMEARVRAVQVIQGRYTAETMPENVKNLMCNSLADFGDFRHQVNGSLMRHTDDFLNRCTPPAQNSSSAPTPTASPRDGGQSSGATPTPLPAGQTPAERTRVYIQIYAEQQTEQASEIQEDLREDHFIVPGIEDLSNTNPALAKMPLSKTDVRYFSDADAYNAGRIHELVKKNVNSTKLNDKPTRSHLKANPGTIEIWLAP